MKTVECQQRASESRKSGGERKLPASFVIGYSLFSADRAFRLAWQKMALQNTIGDADGKSSTIRLHTLPPIENRSSWSLTDAKQRSLGCSSLA